MKILNRFTGSILRVIKGKSLKNADLSWANLSGADLSGADLSGADLSGANLCEADLGGANLKGANLGGTDLSGANLCEADFSGANIDFSCWPLWCGSLRVKTDKKQRKQIAYHLCSLLDTSDKDKEESVILDILVEYANGFHHVADGTCPKIKRK
jgi:hypothetical protein